MSEITWGFKWRLCTCGALVNQVWFGRVWHRVVARHTFKAWRT